MYELIVYSSCNIYLYFVHMSRYEVIILKYQLVARSELLIKRN